MSGDGTPSPRVIMSRTEAAVVYIPDHCRPALLAYIEHHRPVGDFLTAVLSNDLREAVARADDVNLPQLPNYVRFLYNWAPSPCWGSSENVRKWVASHGALINVLASEDADV